MSGEKLELSDDDSLDSEDSLSQLDIWKTPVRDSGTSLELPSTSSLFQKKFEEQRCAQEEDEKARCDARIKKNKKRHLRRKRKAEKREAAKQKISSEKNDTEEEHKWEEVRSFMGVYDHIQGPIGHGKYGPKTELEHEIDEALAKDDFAKAEDLSNKLSAREFGVKVSRAFAAKRAWEKKIIDDQIKIAKRKKRLPWGFEAKERWEMKGNM